LYINSYLIGVHKENFWQIQKVDGVLGKDGLLYSNSIFRNQH